MNSHKLIFGFLIFLFYGVIFLRVEHWPLTDWGVYAYRYHPSKVFVFDLVSGQHNEVGESLLNKLGQSPVTFNAMITRSFLKKDQKEIDRHVEFFLEKKEIKEYLEARSEGAYLIMKTLGGIEDNKIIIKREIYRSYKVL